MESEKPGQNLRSRATSGALWSAASRVIQLVVQLGTTFVLTRLLGAEDFGQLAMVMTLSGFVAVFAELGFSAAIVHEQEMSPEQLSTIFWFNVAVGFGLTIAVFVAAPLVADFYHIAALTDIARVMSTTFFIAAPSVVPRALLVKRMRFGLLARIDVVVSILSAGVALVLSSLGFGVWSLVLSNLTNGVVATVLAFFAAGWVPRIEVRPDAVGGIVRYGTWLTGFNGINYWLRNADNLLIGRVLGATPLGLYNRAYVLMLLPINQVIGVLTSVMFATLASVKDERPRVAAIYLRATGAIAVLAFPMMVGLCAVAEPFIITLFGEKWRGMIQVLRILCPVGLIQATTNPLGWIYTSQGRTDSLFRWGIGAGLLIVVALALGVWLGSIEAVAWAYLVANVLLWPIEIWVPCRMIDVRLSQVVRAVSGPLGASAIMGAAVVVVGHELGSRASAPVVLCVQVAVGVAVYLGVAFLTRLNALSDVLGLLREQRRGLRAGTPGSFGPP